jgi:hypothetical protein
MRRAVFRDFCLNSIVDSHAIRRIARIKNEKMIKTKPMTIQMLHLYGFIFEQLTSLKCEVFLFKLINWIFSDKQYQKGIIKTFYQVSFETCKKDLLIILIFRQILELFARIIIKVEP